MINILILLCYEMKKPSAETVARERPYEKQRLKKCFGVSCYMNSDEDNSRTFKNNKFIHENASYILLSLIVIIDKFY